jgi:CRISPR-associated endonuclease Cas2
MRRRKRSTKIKNKQLTLTAKVLLYFFVFADFLPRPFENKTHYTKRIISGKSDTFVYYKVMKRLEKKGWLKIYKDGRKNLYALTEEGRLEALFVKAQLSEKKAWDGKWRMIVFDIPEDARTERNKLRDLLKANGFKLIQKSVFINPYPLNREAITYLQKTGLDKYIRVFRIDEADNPSALKKMFGL